MPQGAADAPAWFVLDMRLVITGFDNVRMYLDDAIGSDDCPINHVSRLATLHIAAAAHTTKTYTKFGSASCIYNKPYTRINIFNIKFR